ncbi:MAG TPA: proprotein convertase P-domain-containing protein [Thermoanaerobaculia bacterium]|nr:proprotein convertase P-domain-containing protein [Thermoanaerobaculia bacterium]
MLLSLAFAAALDLRLELARESLTGTHCRYREYVQGIPTENYVTAPCGAAGSQPADVFRQAESLPLHWVGDRIARRVIRDHFAEDHDAESGELLRRIPFFFRANVFDPNPVVTLNDPTLQDRNDSASAVPDAAYRTVELQDLNSPYVKLVDIQPPSIAPPTGSLVFNRQDDGFEDVNAFFHIDATQRYLQSIGYRGRRAIAPYAIETDAHAQNGFDSSLFIPDAFHPGRGTLFFGTGGTDDAEDADLVVHEYAHALHEWIAPGSFTGTFTSQARAFGEAFGDYWAFSNHYAQRVQSGRDPFCFADWDARCWLDDASELCAYPPNSDCLRRLDSPKTMRDYDTVEAAGVEHRNGAIMSSALRELFLALGKPVTDTIVIESFFGAPSLPSFAVMAQRIINADQLLYGGSHQTTICSVMMARQILTIDQCAMRPRGEWTQFPSGERAIPIPDADQTGIVSLLTITDPRTIENAWVRVDITHPSRGDLRIDLIAPDGTTFSLQQNSADRARDIHFTYSVNLRGRSAAGVWTLRVADVIFLDAGTLQSWDLVIQFAGDAPSSERPRAARTQMIPVVAHRFGDNDTFFASDLRVANPSNAQQTATLIFTRDGEDGRANFSAVNVVLAPGETAAYDDVVDRVFHTSGSGSLEILGDVLAMSRTYVPVLSGGTLGQTIPPNLDTITQGDAQLMIPYFQVGPFRMRLGFVETAGVAGTVAFTISLERFFVDLPPYGHVQLPTVVRPNNIQVLTPGTRVAAYLSHVDNATGDAMFIPAVRPSGGTRIAPVVDTTGVNASSWRSDLWVETPTASTAVLFVDALAGDVVTRTLPPIAFRQGVLPQTFGRSNTFGMLVASFFAGGAASTRIVNNGTSEYAPFRDPAGAAQQHLLFIESTDAFRTNIGLIANEAALAEVTVYDSEGRVVDQRLLFTPRGLAQTAVTPRVVNGRALVRFLSGTGRAYASTIDNATGDSALTFGQ